MFTIAALIVNGELIRKSGFVMAFRRSVANIEMCIETKSGVDYLL